MSSRESRVGVALAVAAYGMWGLFPVFWKQLGHVPSREQLAHRITWALLVYLLISGLRGEWGAVRRAFAHARDRRVALACAGLIAANWYTYVYAVEHAAILQASLGYFINPLFNVLLGMIFLGERLRKGQWIAVGLAAVGIALMASEAQGEVWISLTLAGAFGLYGLLRKTARVGGLAGATAEALILTPFCLFAIVSWESAGEGHFFTDPRTTFLLGMTGWVTALPLLAFAGAARRISLSTLGFVQYLAPTGQFLLAIFVYGEPLDPRRLGAFIAIWAGLAVFIVEGALRARRTRGELPLPRPSR